MNKIVEKAYAINKLQQEKCGWNGCINWDCGELPDLEVGDVCTIADVWDGEGERAEESYCYKIMDSGEDGKSNLEIWINYSWEVVEKKQNVLDTVINITEIELI